MSTFSIKGNVGETPFIVNGAPGVTVVLSGAASASTTTDGGGNYAFSGLSNGSYVVTPTQPPVVAPVSTPVVIFNANVSGINFSTLGTFTGTVATWLPVATNPLYAGQTIGNVSFTGTIFLNGTDTVVFFNNTQVLNGPLTPTLAVGSMVVFNLAQDFTGINSMGQGTNPKYFGQAVEVYVVG